MWIKLVQLNEKAIKLIDAKNFGFIATVGKDGSPQVTPVWVDREGKDYILVNTAVGRLKQRNLANNNKVAISIADASNQYDMVAIKGVVAEQTINGADDHINKLAKKYLDKDKYPWASPTSKRIILKIKPERISGQ